VIVASHVGRTHGDGMALGCSPRRQPACGGRLRVVLVTVDQDGRQAAVSGASPNLIEPDAGLLALLDRGLMAV